MPRRGKLELKPWEYDNDTPLVVFQGKYIVTITTDPYLSQTIVQEHNTRLDVGQHPALHYAMSTNNMDEKRLFYPLWCPAIPPGPKPIPREYSGKVLGFTFVEGELINDA